jgi:lipoprotein NlpI
MRFLQLVAAFSLLLSLTACSQWSAAYYAAQGDAHLGKGDYDKAIQDYNQAISRDPKLAHALAGRGAAYLYKGDYDRAIQEFNETLRLAPKAALTFDARGSAYFAKGDYDRSLQDLNEAIRLNPKIKRALRNRGMANMYAGHFPEAQQDLSQYFQMDPKDPYRAMWLYLARAKAGTDGKSELKTNTAVLDLSKWPGPVIQLYRDQSTMTKATRCTHRPIGGSFSNMAQIRLNSAATRGRG